MAPKKGKKKTQTLSLAEFNSDPNAGLEPELAKLPSAPKQQNEWDEEGGRPVYNSRGFKERNVTSFDRDGDRYGDDEFDNRDWSRSGPLDGGDGPGGGGGERDWDGMRRGPMDEGEGGGDRDWGSARRGPLDEGGQGADRAWDDMRRQAVEPEGAPGRDVDFGAMRRGPVDAEPSRGAAEIDFTQRRGPIEAEPQNEAAEVDFGVRKGPIDADFSGSNRSGDVDFSSTRRGPMDEPEAEQREFPVRRGPLEPISDDTRDFSTRRGPMDAPQDASRDFSQARGRATVVQTEERAAEPDFGRARSAAKVFDAAEPAGRAAQPAERDLGSARRSTQHVRPEGKEQPTNANTLDWSVRRGPVESGARAPTRANRSAQTSSEANKAPNRDDTIEDAPVRRTSNRFEIPETLPEEDPELANTGDGVAGNEQNRPHDDGDSGSTNSKMPPQRDWAKARGAQVPLSNGSVSRAHESNTRLERRESRHNDANGKPQQDAEEAGGDDWTIVRSTAAPARAARGNSWRSGAGLRGRGGAARGGRGGRGPDGGRAASESKSSSMGRAAASQDKILERGVGALAVQENVAAPES